MSRPIGLRALPSPPTITLASRCAAGARVLQGGWGASASGASPWSDAADFVLAFPFVLEQDTTFYKVFWVNGASAGNTSDVAIYDDSYNFIVGTGAGATGVGANGPTVVALSATTTLPPGLYYAGMTHNATTTGQLFRWSVATKGIAFWQALGCWKSSATDASPLATTPLTPADITNIAFPVFGLITRSVFDV